MCDANTPQQQRVEDLEQEIDGLEKEIRLAVLEEREACAKVCERMWQKASGLAASQTAGHLMREIRARSQNALDMNNSESSAK